MSVVSQLVKELTVAIQGGHYPPGVALPTHRQLAAQKGIATASVSKAYALLKTRGLVIGEVGRGTFVRERPDDKEWDAEDEARLSRHAHDLSFNHPSSPGRSAILRSTLEQLAQRDDPEFLLRQQPPGGRLSERRLVAEFLRTERGIQADPQQVFFVNGAQQGLDIVMRALLKPYDAVAVDALTYPGFKMLAALHRLDLRAVPNLANGPDLNRLARLSHEKRLRAIYTIPTIHNPLGWVLSLDERKALVEIARKADSFLIEDAAYAFLAGKQHTPLMTLAPERTIYVGSLSKSVASGLRFGYIVAPKTYVRQIRSVIRATCWSMPSLTTAIATSWMADGTVKKLETRQRREARLRQLIAQDAFTGMQMTAHPNGLFLWLLLPEELRMDRIATDLANRGIAVSKATAYSTTRHAPHALRLGLSSVPVDKLRTVLDEVRTAIEQFPI